METPLRYRLARFAGRLRPKRNAALNPPEPRKTTRGLSIVIPSRNGKELLAAQLPGITAGLADMVSEVIVVDNGSNDGTAEWLRSAWPKVTVEVSPEPLSFARAVNRGIGRSRYSHICLLNNDMLVEPGFFPALGAAFEKVPNLFCATAQIRFPAGVRREETGKAVMAQNAPEDFPLRCDEPIAGEDLTWVLYGSGGCSVYDAAKLLSLGNVDEVYEPAYVEDLDLGYRAWQRGWPSVYVDGAVVEHRHRATTSRYYTEEDLERILEINYLRFVARAVADPKLFRELWDKALLRLKQRAEHSQAALDALRAAPTLAIQGGPSGPGALPERTFLTLTNGSVAVFPGRAATGKPVRVVATPSLTRRQHPADEQHDQIAVSYADPLAAPAPEILSRFTEVVLVKRVKGREGNAVAFHAAVQQTCNKWRPVEARLETKGMAQYSIDCGTARIVLIG